MLDQGVIGGVDTLGDLPGCHPHLGQHRYRAIGLRILRRVTGQHMVRLPGRVDQRPDPATNHPGPRRDRPDGIFHVNQQHPVIGHTHILATAPILTVGPPGDRPPERGSPVAASELR